MRARARRSRRKETWSPSIEVKPVHVREGEKLSYKSGARHTKVVHCQKRTQTGPSMEVQAHQRQPHHGLGEVDGTSLNDGHPDQASRGTNQDVGDGENVERVGEAARTLQEREGKGIATPCEAVKVLVYPESVDHTLQEQVRFDERREAEEEVAAAGVEALSPGRHP